MLIVHTINLQNDEAILQPHLRIHEKEVKKLQGQLSSSRREIEDLRQITIQITRSNKPAYQLIHPSPKLFSAQIFIPLTRLKYARISHLLMFSLIR